MFIKKIIVFILIILISACNNSDFCDSKKFNYVRKNSLSISDKAEKSLNEITRILNKNNFLTYTLKEDKKITYVYEIFFDLSESNQKLYLVKIASTNELFTDIKSQIIWELPIDEIISENIILQEYYSNGFKENVGTLIILGKYSNQEAFRFKSVVGGVNNLKENECSTTGECLIQLEAKLARELKSQFDIFFKNFKS